MALRRTDAMRLSNAGHVEEVPARATRLSSLHARVTGGGEKPVEVGLTLVRESLADVGDRRRGTQIARLVPRLLRFVDASELEYTSMDHATKHQAVSLIGIKLHVLVSGATYNLHTREAVPAAAEPRG